MKRLLVVDDERPVVDGISLIVKRELAEEFEIAGSASSGREAIEKSMALAPDIVLMDVRMPGITGLEAIREMRSKGAASVFILVTAYERFDIAREAVGLGVLDYLLKPVSKDKLALSLRAAADFLDRRSELERKEIEHREAAERLHSFVEAAFLQGIVLGERPGSEIDKYRSALGLDEAFAMVGSALFLPAFGSETRAEELAALHGRFRDTIRYKTEALAGPLFQGRCLVLLPLRSPAEAEAAKSDFLAAIEAGFSGELSRRLLRLGFGGARRLEEASVSWCEALGEALRPGGADKGIGLERIKPFEEDERFLEDLVGGSPERARLGLEDILASIGREGGQDAGRDRAGLYRIVALLGAGLRGLVRHGLLDPGTAEAMLDFEDLHAAWDGLGFSAAASARLARIAAVMGRTPRRSLPVAKALAFIKENYGRQISLELAADAVGLSPNRLSRLIVEETGRGFSDVLIEQRIEKAKDLLLVPGASIKQVSMSCGYPDPNYFSRLFKKITGMTPTSFSSDAVEANDDE